MTQLCWDMEQFKYWLDAIRKAGITMPVDVGVMPILGSAQLPSTWHFPETAVLWTRELSRSDLQTLAVPESVCSKDADGKPFDAFYGRKERRSVKRDRIYRGSASRILSLGVERHTSVCTE